MNLPPHSSLQKLWLLAPSHVALQLRVPGKNLLAVLDARGARGGVLAFVDERPASPEPALPSQANLRRLIEGARVSRIVHERFAAGEGAKKLSLRLALETPQGPRALVAEARTQLLFVLAPAADEPGEERVVWAAPGAPAERRSGARWPGVVAVEPEPGWSEGAAAEAKAAVTSADRSLAVKRAALARQLEGRLKKLVRARAAVEADLARARGAEGERRKAELVLPHQGRAGRGARELVVPDWTQLDESGAPRQVTIALDPALSAGANAARWLKRAQRYGAALGRIEGRAAELSQGLEATRGLLARVQLAESGPGLATIEAEVEQTRRPEERRGSAAVKGGQRAVRPAATRRVAWRTFTATSGARILVGRSAKDNDTLTRHAKGNDLWLHARGVQGSHVIVPEPGEAPDAKTLGEAALLAAHFSSARGADGAEVSWTRRKFVRKAKGAAPGAVTYTQEKTLRLRLDDALLARLLSSEG